MTQQTEGSAHDKVEGDTSPLLDNSTPVSPITKLFGVEQEQISRCTKCGSENAKKSPVLLSSLTLQDLEGIHNVRSIKPNHKHVFLKVNRALNMY